MTVFQPQNYAVILNLYKMAEGGKERLNKMNKNLAIVFN